MRTGVAELGVIRDDVDGASVSVAPVECSLRTLQHLNAGEVVEVTTEAIRSTYINAIHIKCDAGAGERAVGKATDTPNEDLIVDAALSDIHSSGQFLQVRGLAYPRA